MGLGEFEILGKGPGDSSKMSTPKELKNWGG
jgi:hypothetical protein